MNKDINCGSCGKPTEGAAFHRDAQACASASEQKVIRQVRTKHSSNYSRIAYTYIQYSGK
jgi:hypothetical protein